MPIMPRKRTSHCRRSPSFFRKRSPRSAVRTTPSSCQGSKKSDWEVELGIVIGTRASYVERADALAHVAGYCVVNDVSEREYQMERGGTWDKGKGCDTFGPVGPWLVTTDEIADPQALDLWLDVNGQRMQQGNTRTMIFGCAEIVSYVSRFMTLMPGDIIATGTPPGVGMGNKPEPIYLMPGDVMTLGIESLGTQRQEVRGWSVDIRRSGGERLQRKVRGPDRRRDRCRLRHWPGRGASPVGRRCPRVDVGLERWRPRRRSSRSRRAGHTSG